MCAVGFYGNDTELAKKLDELGYTYMFDIHSNQTIFMGRTEWVLLEKKVPRGRSPKLINPDKPSLKVDNYCRKLGAKDWKELSVKNTAKGKLKAGYHFVRYLLITKPVTPLKKVFC